MVGSLEGSVFACKSPCLSKTSLGMADCLRISRLRDATYFMVMDKIMLTYLVRIAVIFRMER